MKHAALAFGLIVGSLSYCQAQNVSTHDCIQRGLGCYESLYIGSIRTDKVEYCLGYCQADAECAFFNYDGNTQECFKLANCGGLGESCQDCYYGASSCADPLCWVSGARCQGNLVSNFTTRLSNDCILACKADPLCQWFSYNALESECLLTQDCQEMDETCKTCVYGQAFCKQRDSVIVAVGGHDNSWFMGDAEVIDLSNASLTCETIDNYPLKISDPLLDIVDGCLKLCGGSAAGSYNKLCYDYDVGARSWVQSTSLLKDRYRHRGSFIDGMWLVSGSATSDSAPNTTEIWTGNRFIPGPPLPEGMQHHCQITLNATHVFFADGRDQTTYILDWEFQLWTQLEPLMIRRDKCVCGLISNVDNGYEIVVSGEGTSEIFNVATYGWREGPQMPLDYMFTSAGQAQLHDTFAVVGGSYGDNVYNTIYIFDNVNYGWILSDKQLQTERFGAGVTAVPPDFLNCS